MNKLYIALGVVLIVLGAHVWDKNRAVSKAVAQLEQKYELALKESENKAKETTILIAAQSRAIEKDKDEKVRIANERANNLLMQLQQRPSRPADYSPITETIYSCSGAQLYREDGEFLTREANRAQRILEERDYYYNEYENARKRLNEFTPTPTR